MLSRLWIALLILSVGIAGCDTSTPTPEPSASATATEPTAATQRCDEPPCRRAPRTVGTFDVDEAPEASGLAVGHTNPDVFYILDDGPGTTSLLVVAAPGGRTLGRIAIEGFSGTDTEAIAVARCGRQQPDNCIFIGDIGDNRHTRSEIELLRVPEPRIRGRFGVISVAADRVTLRYPDRAQDAEALLVDDDGTVGIVSKRPGRRGLGNGHLFVMESFTDGTLTDVGRVPLPAPAAPLTAVFLGNLVTGGDSQPGRVVLRTYDGVYEFRGPKDGALDDFPTWPVTQVTAPTEPQGEAIAYGADGCSIFTVSEESGRITGMPCRG